MPQSQIIVGDCRESIKGLPDNSVDSIVTDPPYELGFMGKSWDASGIAYDVSLWRECLRVLKPGGHLLAFSGSRTYHRMTCAIEDAGFEIRDQIQWVYGSGFPKSLNVGKALDKAAGAEREVLARNPNSRENCTKDNTLYESGTVGKTDFITAPATEAAKQWDGWGTALKPAHEPICVARKPLEGTVADNVMKWGTGAINVDGCRVGTEGGTSWESTGDKNDEGQFGGGIKDGKVKQLNAGRWPANLIHDGSQEVLAGFPQSKAGAETQPRGKGGIWSPSTGTPAGPQYGDSGSAARFFYCPKASKKDRDDGCEGMPEVKAGAMSGEETREDRPTNHPMRRNFHPTVKPTDLMRYLCRLVTPPGGTVLDPFTGSGSTGRGAILEGFSFIGCELSEDYATIAKARIAACLD